MIRRIEVSYRTIIFTAVFLILLWFLYQIRDIIFLIFVSFILTAAFRPSVDRLEKWKFPRFLAIFINYVLLIAIISVLGRIVIPVMVSQTGKLLNHLPYLISSLTKFLEVDPQLFAGQIAPLSGNLFKVTLGVFNNAVGFLTILVFTFYLLLEHQNLEKFLKDLIGDALASRTLKVIKKIEDSLGTWVRAQLTLMLVIGVVTFFGLTLLRIDYALPLALLAGALEIIPSLGPTLSAVPAILVALSYSPFLALATAALYFIIQQTENSFVVPLVMKKATGLPPLVTILAITVGFRLTGVAGALLSIPLLLTLQIIIKEILLAKKS